MSFLRRPTPHLTHLEVTGRACMDDPGDVRPGTLDRRRFVAAWRRLLREEEGVALILALLVMLVLTIVLTTVIFLTAAGARDAQRTNAGQRAYSLAESGINNALGILNAAYPDTTHAYPGDKCLLHPQTVPT